MNKLANIILQALPAVAADSDPRGDLLFSREGAAAGNQCVLFLKPEATALSNGVNVRELVELTLSAMAAQAVHVSKVRILNGSYLKRYSIMDAHYGVINRISRLGEQALSADSKGKLAAVLEAVPSARIMGGHQFQAMFPDFSSFALNVLSDSVGTGKLGGGTYFIVSKVSGETIILLNPFHLHQLEHFTAPGKSIVLFECQTNTAWTSLRQDLIGATNPAVAKIGSIRHTLLQRREQLGLSEVSQGVNGVHLSAGPVEGMIEYQRFFSDHIAGQVIPFQETGMGSLLLRYGWDMKRIELLAENPEILLDGKRVSAFDATEELDTTIAAELLAYGKDPSAA